MAQQEGLRADFRTSMKMPGAEYAIVEDAKVRDYLLSTEHPIGRFKAVFFGALGYTRAGWKRLRFDLLQIAQSQEAALGQASQFGQKYEVSGTLRGPSGRSAGVMTVWIILRSEDTPRLVTAFPDEAP